VIGYVTVMDMEGKNEDMQKSANAQAKKVLQEN
jgi:hypothetical protein